MIYDFLNNPFQTPREEPPPFDSSPQIIVTRHSLQEENTDGPFDETQHLPEQHVLAPCCRHHSQEVIYERYLSPIQLALLSQQHEPSMVQLSQQYEPSMVQLSQQHEPSMAVLSQQHEPPMALLSQQREPSMAVLSQQRSPPVAFSHLLRESSSAAVVASSSRHYRGLGNAYENVSHVMH